MTSPLPRIGLFGGDEAVAHGLDRLAGEIGAAEQAGFATYWVPQKFALDALTALAIAGRVVPRIELGTAVIPIQPRHPAVLAAQALTTQLAVDGRLVLGLGVSHRILVADRLGLGFGQPFTAMQEYMQVLNPLLHGEHAEFHGTTVGADVALTIGAAPPCPVILGALGPRMLDLAGSSADGTITWAVGPRTLENHTVPLISAAATRAGRPPPRVIAGFAVCVTGDPAAARQRAAEMFRLSREYPSYRRVLDLEGADDVGEIALIGDEDELLKRFAQLRGIGVTDVACTEICASTQERNRTRQLLSVAASVAASGS
jgi:5,10-methylenetetrahydromethanopterin reductase